MGNRVQFSRSDLAAELARKRPDLHVDQALGIIDMLFLIIGERVFAGERVSVRGFGTFHLGKTPEVRKGRKLPNGTVAKRTVKSRPRVSFRSSSVINTTFEVGG